LKSAGTLLILLSQTYQVTHLVVVWSRTRVGVRFMHLALSAAFITKETAVNKLKARLIFLPTFSTYDTKCTFHWCTRSV